MGRIRDIATVLLMAGCSSFLAYQPAHASGDAEPANPATAVGAQDPKTAGQGAQAPAGSPIGKLIVTVGKSLIIDSPLDIRRVSVANADLVEAVAVTPREVLLNGKGAGETSLIIWQSNGTRVVYDLTVRMSNAKLDAARQQIARDFPTEDINLTFENDTAFVRGTVKDVTAAERVMSIAATLGKSVNLLRVSIPDVEQQVVLKVRFATVDRSLSTNLGVNLFSTAFNQTTALGTGSPISNDNGKTINIGTAVNILLARPDLNLAATIEALEAKRILEILAEPNLLAISGQQASFLAGGEFPFPVVQPSASGTAIAIMWREYGVRLNFLPIVTPRGTIRLKVMPEVSSLDFTNSVTVAGLTIPGLATRRVQTEVELESGQSFVIAGLLDNQVTDNLSKVPGIANIPILGKLFQTKQVTKSSTELMVIITPEVVRPIPTGQAVPRISYPKPFLPTDTDASAVTQPGMDKTGPVPVHPVGGDMTIPVEQLMKKDGATAATAPPMFQIVPVAPAAPPPPANPGLTPPPIPGGNGK